jgi:hypothetical protein
MALAHINAQSFTTATILFTLPAGLKNTAVQICNNHSAVLYIGGSSVTTSGATRGSQVAANATQQVWLNSGDSVYGITAANTAAGAISIIYSGV